MADGVASFSGIPANIILRVCEAIMAKTPPQSNDWVEFNGVKMRVAHLDLKNTDFERYMLIGRDWRAGFNLSVPAPNDSDNVHMVFGSPHKVTQPGVENQDAFVRDMVVMKMTHSDWRHRVFTS